MRKLFSLILTMLLTASLYATKVIDAETKQPVVGATVVDRNGVVVAITDAEGKYPDNASYNYPLTIRCLGYDNSPVKGPTATVMLTLMPYDLPEVVIAPSTDEILHQLFYERLYMSMISASDTSIIFVERMSDNFLPLKKKLKEYKGRKKFRLLAQRSYGRFSRVNNSDSLVSNVDIKDMEMVPHAWEYNKEWKEPKQLDGKSEGSFFEDGKSGPEKSYIKTAKTFTVVDDELAFKKDHQYNITMFKILGFSMLVKDMTAKYVYNVNATGHYDTDDLRYMSELMTMTMKGRFVRKSTKKDEPVTVCIYSEVYPVKRQGMTAAEAKKLDSEKPDTKIIVPKYATPLDGSVRKLIHDVNEAQKR